MLIMKMILRRSEIEETPEEDMAGVKHDMKCFGLSEEDAHHHNRFMALFLGPPG